MTAIWPVLILVAVLFIAYANGANDNFKGVATLFGSGVADYRKALGWATITTLFGSLCSYFWAEKLLKTFSGKGLVPDALVSSPAFLAAVILGAGATVFVASKIGIPISTTHGLTGALMGAGLVALGGKLGFSALGKNFCIPLISSPVMALGLAIILYSVFHWTRQAIGISRQSCVCVGEKEIIMGSAMTEGVALPAMTFPQLEVFVGQREGCEVRAVEVYSGKMFGLAAQKILDGLHFLSAGAVSFARGLNDTPKIVALSVAAGTLGLGLNIAAVAMFMALGGIISAKKVAETMSKKITAVNPGQGLTANLVTAFLVIFASRLGVPVSTTHVSCGSLFGIGLMNRSANGKTITSILLAWIVTLPLAAMFAAVFYYFLNILGHNI